MRLAEKQKKRARWVGMYEQLDVGVNTMISSACTGLTGTQDYVPLLIPGVEPLLDEDRDYLLVRIVGDVYMQLSEPGFYSASAGLVTAPRDPSAAILVGTAPLLTPFLEPATTAEAEIALDNEDVKWLWKQSKRVEIVAANYGVGFGNTEVYGHLDVRVGRRLTHANGLFLAMMANPAVGGGFFSARYNLRAYVTPID